MKLLRIKVNKQPQWNHPGYDETWLNPEHIEQVTDLDRVTRQVGGTPVEFEQVLEIRLISGHVLYTKEHTATEVIKALSATEIWIGGTP